MLMFACRARRTAAAVTRYAKREHHSAENATIAAAGTAARHGGKGKPTPHTWERSDHIMTVSIPLIALAALVVYFA
jgi:hypothetical protein